MSATRTDTFWFLVEQDIPELDLTAGDCIMASDKIWVCRRFDFVLRREHEPLLTPFGSDQLDYPFADGTPHLTLMD